MVETSIPSITKHNSRTNEYDEVRHKIESLKHVSRNHFPYRFTLEKEDFTPFEVEPDRNLDEKCSKIKKAVRELEQKVSTLPIVDRIVEEVNNEYVIEELDDTSISLKTSTMENLFNNYLNGEFALKEFYGKKQWKKAMEVYNENITFLKENYNDHWIALSHCGEIICALDENDTDGLDESTIKLNIADYVLMRNDDILMPAIVKVGSEVPTIALIYSITPDQQGLVWKCNYKLQGRMNMTPMLEMCSIIDTGSPYTICDEYHITKAGGAEPITCQYIRGFNSTDSFIVTQYRVTVTLCNNEHDPYSMPVSPLELAISASNTRTPHGGTVVGRDVFNKFTFCTFPDQKKYYILECHSLINDIQDRSQNMRSKLSKMSVRGVPTVPSASSAES